MSGQVLTGELASASDAVNNQVLHGFMSDAKGRLVLADFAKKLVANVNPASVPTADTLAYANAFLTAGIWPSAETLFKKVLQEKLSPEDKVDVTLKVAKCEANLGNVQHAIQLCRSTFTVSPQFKWPILYAVYLEVVPASLLHSKNEEIPLARLVEDAIHQHMLAVGDPTIPAQLELMRWRNFHITKAWELVKKLYGSASPAEVKRAEKERRDQSLEIVNV